MATHKALLHIRDKPPGQVVMLTDSPTALQRIQGGHKDSLTHNLIHNLILSVSRVTLQWIPAHGNEMADALAKSGGRLEQVEQPANYLES